MSRYDKLVNFCMIKNIKLEGEYKDINRDTIIFYFCKDNNCNKLVSKTYYNLLKSSGYCRNCTFKPINYCNSKIDYYNKLYINRYNKLVNYCITNNITLTRDYSHSELSDKEVIEGKCLTQNCDKIFGKTLDSFYKSSGYCKDCMNIKSREKIKLNYLERYGVESNFQIMKNRKYSLNKLFNYCNDNQIILYGLYDENIYSTTIINGKCSNKDCNMDFKLSFYKLIQNKPLCKLCKRHRNNK